MHQNVQIRLLGDFDILVDGVRQDNLAAKSLKGVSLMEYLILQRGRPVPVQRLIRELWSGNRYDRPEGALKTMVSRFRALLNGIHPRLGSCIVSEQGAYRWVSGEDINVDVLEMIERLERVQTETSREAKIACYRRVLELYQGDLFQTGDLCNGAMQASWLHREFLYAMYAWIELLKTGGDYEEICRVCREAILVDSQDEQLHIELMRAMMLMNHTSEAIGEFRFITKAAHQQDWNAARNLNEDYQRMMKAGEQVLQTLSNLYEELTDSSGRQAGPFFCDFDAFKEIYSIQERTVERLGSTMFLGVIMINHPDEVSIVARESAMTAVCEILRGNLRRGDVVTRAAPTVFAMLLPTVSYSTGGMVMERIEKLFYEEFPNKSVSLSARVTPLGGRIEELK